LDADIAVGLAEEVLVTVGQRSLPRTIRHTPAGLPDEAASAGIQAGVERHALATTVDQATVPVDPFAVHVPATTDRLARPGNRQGCSCQKGEPHQTRFSQITHDSTLRCHNPIPPDGSVAWQTTQWRRTWV